MLVGTGTGNTNIFYLGRVCHINSYFTPVCLVLAVLGWILSTLDASLADEAENAPFNNNSAQRGKSSSISRHGLKHRK
jgi:hypothetical protein